MALRTGSTSLRQRGFTLAESLVASVVLALAVVGVSSALVASQQQTIRQEDDAVAVSLARQLMEKVASTPLVLSDGGTGAAGWPGVTDATLYDTANDFDGYRDVVTNPVFRNKNITVTFSSGEPAATIVASGDPDPTLSDRQYLRSVAVTYPTSMFSSAITTGDMGVIAVTVRGASGGSVTLSRVVTNASISR